MYNFVSIIIPALNAEKYLYQCLKALTEMNYPREKYELILVDNGSEDRTVDIAKDFNVTTYIKPNLTISGLRNFGAERAKGDILAFVDTDCIVSANWLIKIPNYFLDAALGAVGSYPVIPENATWVQKTWYLNKQYKKTVHETRWLSSMNLIIRKDLFKEIGGFNEKLETCEDVDLCYRIPSKFKIVYDRDITATHLGEARTLNHFFRKELWRGKGNLQGILEHGLSLREFPSIAIPVYYLMLIIILPFIIIAVYLQYDFSIWLFIFLFLLPAIAAAVKVAVLSRHGRYLFYLIAVYLTYFIARALAIIKK